MNLVELSQRLKQRRLELGMSLEEASRAANQTRSWLSKVENFRITPSLPALARMAEVLGTSLASLLDGLDAKPKITLTRMNDRRTIERDTQNSNITYHSLVSGRMNRRMDPFLLDVPPKGGRTVSRPHEGEEFLLVLEGKVSFIFGGEQYELNEGDSLYFDAETPHRLDNPHKKNARVLCVFMET